MEMKQYIFKNRLSGEYWVCRGTTTAEKKKATKFNSEQAARFFRTVAHPNKWIKVEVFY